MWLVLRVYVGWQWAEAGWHKVAGEQPFDASGFIKGAIAKASGDHPAVQGWYAGFLERVALPNVGIFNFLVAYGELLVGVALILGFATMFAAFMGALMNLNFMLGRQHQHQPGPVYPPGADPGRRGLCGLYRGGPLVPPCLPPDGGQPHSPGRRKGAVRARRRPVLAWHSPGPPGMPRAEEYAHDGRSPRAPAVRPDDQPGGTIVGRWCAVPIWATQFALVDRTEPTAGAGSSNAVSVLFLKSRRPTRHRTIAQNTEVGCGYTKGCGGYITMSTPLPSAVKKSIVLSLVVLGAYVVAGYGAMTSLLYHEVVPVGAAFVLAGMLLAWWPLLRTRRPIWRATQALVGVVLTDLVLVLVTLRWPEVQVYEGGGGTDGIPAAASVFLVGLMGLCFLVPLSLLVDDRESKG